MGIGLLLLFVGGAPYIPRPLWAVLLMICLAAALYAAGGHLKATHQYLLYGVAVLTSWGLLLTMPDQGMLVVLLVVVAAVGSYTIPIPAVFCVVFLNCLVVMVHLIVHGADVMEVVASTVFHAIIHIAAVFSTYALWRETQLRAELEQKTVELEAASVLLEDSAKTSERLRISRELHDLIGHQLTVLNLELEAAKHRDPPAAHIARAAGVAKELLADVRVTVGELRESEVGDLRAVLDRLAAAVPSMAIEVRVDGGVRLDEQQSEALIRAAQEIITNTVKHAEAYRLWLTVEQSGSEVRLTGVNDGASPRRITPGHGLNGLRERVELLGGHLAVRTHPHFTVTVTVPVHAPGPVLS